MAHEQASPTSREGHLKMEDWKMDVDNLEEECRRMMGHVRPKWNPADTQFVYFTDGITNKLIGCFDKETGMKDCVLVRVNGEGTEQFIDRDAEVRTFELLSAAKFGPPLYAVFSNGIVYGFVQGKPLDEELVRQENVARLIAQKMVQLHNIHPNNMPPTEQKSQYAAKTQTFLDIIPKGFDDPEKHSRFIDHIPAHAELQAELNAIVEQLDAMKMPIVFSHNDLLLKNIVFDSQSKPEAIHFIDFEYAFLNYQAYDIGNHFCEYAGIDEVNYDLYPDKEYQLKWLRHYLHFDCTARGKSPKDVTDAAVEKMYMQTNKCACAAHFFWGVWALTQAKYSQIDFDFLGYAITRLDEYFKLKKQFFPCVSH